MKKKEIKKRIEELTGKLEAIHGVNMPEAVQRVIITTQIDTLKWVLKYWDKGYYEKV